MRGALMPHARYDWMVETTRQAQTLSWSAAFHTETPNGPCSHCTYRIPLKKHAAFSEERLAARRDD